MRLGAGMTPAELTIDLAKITENTRRAVAVCRPFGIEVLGVTKSACGHPPVARAMLAGGIKALADSRLGNIARMREAGITDPIALIRTPALSETAECVRLADVSHHASLEVLRALSAESAKAGKAHGVMLMADLDTGREGFRAEELPRVCAEVSRMESLDIRGIGVYFARALPTEETLAKQRELVALAKRAEAECGIPLPVVSGGSSYAFCDATMKGRHVPGINELRIGMVILQGISSSKGPQPVEGFHHDTATLKAEIIELKRRNDRRIGICAVGRLDVNPDHIFPVAAGARVLNVTSDHTIVDLEDVAPSARVGDCVEFRLAYYGMSRLILSPYVAVSEIPDPSPGSG